MARGGARSGAGRPKKSLAEKLLDGNPGKRPLKVIEFTGERQEEKLPEAPDWLSAEGERIFNATIEWLKQTDCLPLINPKHIEEYAMCRARWLECEAMNSKHGLLAKHPTTGQPIQSPYVQMAILFLKQTDAAWNKIYAVIKENCAQEYKGNPNQDVMEQLLSMKRR